MNKGLFITFEGVDGSGKTSVITGVSNLLKENGYTDFIITREPGGSKISEDIRNIILDKNNTEEDIRTEALLYAASRRQHLVDIVLKRIDEGTTVISDRYIDSSLAYQGYARGLGIENVLKINEFAIDGLFPDLTIYLDLDPKIGLERIQKGRQEKRDRLDNEKLNFHQKVYEGYKIIKDMYKDRFYTVDASKDLNTIILDVYKKIEELIKNND